MAIEIRFSDAPLGHEIRGVDLSKPLPEADFAQIEAAYDTYGVVVVRNQTLTPEALTKQYLEVLEGMKTSSNLVILVPTEGGVPVLNIGDLRKNLVK